MLCIFGQSLEVVKEGRILQLLQVKGSFVFYQINCILILFPPNVTSLILGHSGTFCRDCKAEGRQRMISNKQTLKHIPG
jgi:hypothetical protein